MKSAAIHSSTLTHSHPAASAGAVVIARAVSYLLKKAPKKSFSTEEFIDTLMRSISIGQDEIWKEFQENLAKLKENLNMDIESGLIKFSQVGVKSPYFIEQYLGKAFVHPYAMSTVICSLFVFLKLKESFEKCIFALATAGGDTDTAGAIGGSLIGTYQGYENIPSHLTNLVKGRKKVLKVSKKLHQSFTKRF